MLHLITPEETREQTRALHEAVPEARRAEVAERIRRYADAVQREYDELSAFLTEQLGDGAAVVLRQINEPSVATDRDAADRLDGTRDEFGRLPNEPDDGRGPKGAAEK